MSEEEHKRRVLLPGASSDIGLALNQKYLNDGFLRLRFIVNHACEFIPRLTCDWATSNVLTNVVRIGVTNTKGNSTFSNRNLIGRAISMPEQQPADRRKIADCIFWLGSKQSTYVTGRATTISGDE
ncbi:MAG: hypothetical protein OSA11_00800 [Candidatus Nanopelagicales bacterium]|nr:hypothetical protein [Candidatus Nanopelagicales bacterium]